MAIVINGQTGIDAGHLPISNAGNTEIEGTLTGADVTVASITANSVITQGQNVTPFSGFKNYIINGDFKVNQYNADTAVAITSAVSACDRFYGFASQNGKITAQRRSPGAVTMGEAQFGNCLQVLTVAGYAPNSTDNFNITQKIEGLSIANLRFGKSNAKTITLSFWVRSSVVGLHCVSFKNATLDRSYVATYTINSANTFEYKTITIQGDTTGTWLYDNGTGLCVVFNLANGSSLSTPTPNQWVSGSYNTTVGAVNDIATTGNEFILTGVQLEEGSVATPFENRPYATELALCHRYFETTSKGLREYIGGGYFDTTTLVNATWLFRVAKRVAPTINSLPIGAMSASYPIANGQFSSTTSSSSNIGLLSASISFSVSAAATSGLPCSVSVRGDLGSNYVLTASAEL